MPCKRGGLTRQAVCSSKGHESTTTTSLTAQARLSTPQELLEMAVRGIDGPGLFIMDVLPDAFAGADCWEVRRTYLGHASLPVVKVFTP